MSWHFPFWIAHRGAGKLAPENTLAAFRVGAQHGYRAFECDVKLSADGVPFLLHDDTLNRTTGFRGEERVAGKHTWPVLSQQDAGRWHSRAYAGERLPTLAAVAAFVQANGYALNIEIKPTLGMEAETGTAVANAVVELWRGVSFEVCPVLLSSFKLPALQAAQTAQPHIPRGLLVDVFRDEWLEQASSLDCAVVVFNHALWDESRVQAAHAGGFKALSYTVNDECFAQRLIDLGTDGIITDRVDLFSPGQVSKLV